MPVGPGRRITRMDDLRPWELYATSILPSVALCGCDGAASFKAPAHTGPPVSGRIMPRRRCYPSPMNIFFDILGTLLTEQGEPRPHAREVLIGLAGTGHGVLLWSTAGEGYAARAARVLGVEGIIRGCCLKRHPSEGITVDYVVDDDGGVVEEYGGYVVGPYGGDQWDSELLWVLDEIKAL